MDISVIWSINTYMRYKPVLKAYDAGKEHEKSYTVTIKYQNQILSQNISYRKPVSGLHFPTYLNLIRL